MKKYLSLLICIVPILVKAQTSLVYDFNTKALTLGGKAFDPNLVTIKSGSNLIVDIKNINRFLYDVTVTINTQEFFKTATTITPFNAADLPNLLNEVEVAGSLPPLPSSQRSTLLDYNNSVFTNYPEAEKETIENQFIEFENTRKDDYPKFKEYIKAFKKREDIFNIGTIDEKTLVNLGWADAKAPTKLINKTDSNYQVAITLYSKIYRLTETIKKYESIILASQKLSFDTFASKFEGANYDTSLETYRNNELNVTNECIEYTSDQPVTVTGDEATITIAITPKATVKTSGYAVPLFGETKTYNISIIRGWKVSFGTGIFASKLTNNRYTFKDSYKIRTPDALGKPISFDTTAYRTIIQDVNDSWAMGVNTLMYCSYKWTKYDALGFHIGLGTAIQTDFKPNYLLGISYIRGYKQQIGFNIGIAGGQIDELSNNADLNRRYDPATTTIPTATKFVFNRLQFSITYNLFNDTSTGSK